jgi:molecular chaperone DnaK
MARDNRTLARFHLDGIPAAPRGVPQIEVAFDIDADGILHVSAKDMATGKEQRVRVTASSGLNEQEIQRMVKDAELHAEEDRKRREVVQLKNQLDSLAYALEKTVNENKGKLEAPHIDEAERAVSRAKEALSGEDAEALRGAIDEVNNASHKLAEVLYKHAAAGQGAEGPQGGEVIDAEVTENK